MKYMSYWKIETKDPIEDPKVQEMNKHLRKRTVFEPGEDSDFPNGLILYRSLEALIFPNAPEMVKVEAGSWFGRAHWDKLLCSEKKKRHDEDVAGTEAEIKRLTEINLVEVTKMKSDADVAHTKAVAKLNGLR